MKVTLLTFCSRPEFLPCVANSITPSEVPTGMNLRWLVKMNPAYRIQWEEHIRIWDETIRELTATWVLLLSDDTTLHPDFLSSLAEHAKDGVKMIHFRQQFGPASFRPANLGHLVGGLVDGGQIAFDADYYNSFGWSYAQFGYEGHLFRRMHDANPAAFSFVDKTCSYHDRLRWL